MWATMRCMSRVAWAWWQDLYFLEGLGAGKGGFELPHGPGHAAPGNAGGLVTERPAVTA